MQGSRQETSRLLTGIALKAFSTFVIFLPAFAIYAQTSFIDSEIYEYKLRLKYRCLPTQNEFSNITTIDTTFSEWTFFEDLTLKENIRVKPLVVRFSTQNHLLIDDGISESIHYLFSNGSQIRQYVDSKRSSLLVDFKLSKEKTVEIDGRFFVGSSYYHQAFYRVEKTFELKKINSKVHFLDISVLNPEEHSNIIYEWLISEQYGVLMFKYRRGVNCYECRLYDKNYSMVDPSEIEYDK